MGGGGGGQCPLAGSVVWVNYSLKNAAKANITASINHLLHEFRLQLNSSSWAHLSEPAHVGRHIIESYFYQDVLKAGGVGHVEAD